ncbi:hypothetical protein ARAM_004085 [Aspergillus rambellii]|uniref:Mitochondrial F1F0-ATP synthase g subunit n=1 Tax=Aspergillus rambellii TaxID=308745 RepID=A0A0F8VE46_9EURO|nr:hypothetical protein ARAM_004085 [Aspergillus rambellii]
MPATASRAVLRQSQFLTRRTAVRYSSSSSQAASKASEAASAAASAAASKASEGLSPLIPPTLYYSKVGLELGKLVFRGQNMTPPSMATFQSYFQPLINSLRSPAAFKNANFVSPQQILARVRNANKKEIALAGVTAAEVIGFFTVGEIIGRMNIVGYKGHPSHEHH